MTIRMKSAMVETSGPGRYAVLAAIALTAFASSASAQTHTLRDAFGRAAEARRPAAPPIARYVAESGSVFVLDRANSQPLLKFENSNEVWVLSPQPAPRGDVIYKNEMGEPVLRATKLGGMILFTPERPAGAAASLTGQGGNSLQLPSMISLGLFIQRLKQASIRASRAAQHPVWFETVEDATPVTSVLVADTATVTAEAFERMARKDRSLLSRITRVLLSEGRKPGASLKGDALTVTYTPGKGVSGRPSSERIVKIVSR
jgi:hypothetical protein